MVDKLSIQRIQTLHPKLRTEAIQVITEVGCVLTGRAMFRVTEGFRSFATQASYYAQGRTKPGKIITNARPGSSLHNYGLALDFAFIIDGKTASWDDKRDWDDDKISDWMEVVMVFEKHGWTWGGRWKSLYDGPHFEKTFGYRVSQLLELHNAKKVDSSGYVII